MNDVYMRFLRELSQIPNAVCVFIIFNEFIQLHENSINGIQRRKISHRPMKLPIIIYLLLTTVINWSVFIRYIMRSRSRKPKAHAPIILLKTALCIRLPFSTQFQMLHFCKCTRIWIYNSFTAIFFIAFWISVIFLRFHDTRASSSLVLSSSSNAIDFLIINFIRYNFYLLLLSDSTTWAIMMGKIILMDLVRTENVVNFISEAPENKLFNDILIWF